MQRVNYQTIADTVMTQIRNNGAFLIAQVRDRINTMTIGWASIGFVWGRPVFMVTVRNSRHTFGIMEQATDFTVSIPMKDMAKELELCGTKSGRSIDKFKTCNLELFPAVKIHTPIIKLFGYHYECKIVYRSAIDPAHLIDDYQHLYPNKDFHTLYYGEIVECYSTMDEIND